MIKSISLTNQDVTEIERLLDTVFSGKPTVDIDKFLLEAHIISHALPEHIRRSFYQFKLTESSVGICIKNNYIDFNRIGSTPHHYNYNEAKKYATREEVLHILYASLLGEVFGWSSLQGGRIINEIIPLKEYEDQGVAFGSKVPLNLHTEDAFHPYRADYVGLMCLRNPGRVPTIISSLDGIRLDEDVKRILFEPRFFMGASSAHKVKVIPEMGSVLFGSQEDPYIRFNIFNVSDTLKDDQEAMKALDILKEQLASNTIELILDPGDCLYLDNYKSVHGRKTYVPNYDGNNRWLKRIQITRDLRKSRMLRDQPQSRIIRPLDPDNPI